MKFKLIVVALVLAFGLAVAANGQASEQAAAQVAKAPKLAISKTQHDLGTIKRGTQARYSFTFKNEGTADLTINNVAPS